MRLTGDEAVKDAIIKLGEGNPGALTVCMEILKFCAEKNPSLGVVSGLPFMLALDNFGIYGSRIWMLFKDVCGENLKKMLTVLVGGMMGLVDQSELDYAIGNRGARLDLDALIEVVVERNPELNPDVP